VSWYQKGKTSLDFPEARDSEWQWHQLGHMQVCTSLQTDNQPHQHPTTQLFTGRMPFLPPNQQCQSTEGNCHIILTGYKMSHQQYRPIVHQSTAFVQTRLKFWLRPTHDLYRWKHSLLLGNAVHELVCHFLLLNVNAVLLYKYQLLFIICAP